VYRDRYPWEKEGENCKYCLGSGSGLGGACKHCMGLGRTFKGEARDPCKPCKGTGQVEGKECEKCKGKGWDLAREKPRKACGFCMGSGKKLGGSACLHCGGTGYMELDEKGQTIDLTAGAAAKETKCPYCLGLGYKQRGMPCEQCNGTGKSAKKT